MVIFWLISISVWPMTRNSSCTFSKTSFTIDNDKKTSKCRFLLSFRQLSICSNNFFGNGFAPTTCSSAFNAFKHQELLYISYSKNSFCSSWSNNLCDSRILGSFFKVHNSCKKNPILKLGHNSFEYWANASSSCPWAIIPISVVSNWPNATTYCFLLATLVV